MLRLFLAAALAFMTTIAAAQPVAKPVAAAAAFDPASIALLSILKQRYPNTTFTQVRPSILAGLYEVQMGNNLAYTNDQGNYFFFGSLYDMQGQRDLTAERRLELGIQPQAQGQARAEANIAWKDLPLENAFVRVKGKGARKLALFSDPDCPYCKRLELDLDKMEDVTIYTFMYPLASLHPQAQQRSETIWCAGNAKTRAGLWDAYMKEGKLPEAKNCVNPVSANVELGNRLGVNGTPTMFTGDGRRITGAQPLAVIESFLAQTK